MRTDLLASLRGAAAGTRPGTRRKRFRIGTKALSFWPYRPAGRTRGGQPAPVARAAHRRWQARRVDAAPVAPGRVEEPTRSKAALSRLASTGAALTGRRPPVVRAMSMTTRTHGRSYGRPRVRNGVVPYYMFVERDNRRTAVLRPARSPGRWTSIALPCKRVSGLRGGTARGPVMSATFRQGCDRWRGRTGPWASVRVAHAAGAPTRHGRQAVLRPPMTRTPQWWDELRPYGQRVTANFFRPGRRSGRPVKVTAQ